MPVRQIAGELPILCPASAPRVATWRRASRRGRPRPGTGLMLSASRSVLYASGGDDFAEAARAEALRTIAAITPARAAR